MKTKFGLRKYAGFAAVLVAAAVSVGTALADVSPGPVSSTSTTLYWTGQGTPVDQQCGDFADPGAGGYQNGASAGSYMLWIFATDGGSVAAVPTLTINNITYGNAYKPAGQNADFGFPGAWQIVTPYVDPSTITPADKNDDSSTGNAYTSFTVGGDPAGSDTGSGSWVLTISHGCSGGTVPKAQDLTVTKDASGSYDTTYTWGITKSACAHGVTLCTQKVDAVGGTVTFDYTIVVTHDAGAISNVKVVGTIVVHNPNTHAVNITGVTDTALSDGTACSVTNGGAQSVPGLGTTPASGPGAITYECDYPAGSAVPTGVTNTVTVSWPDQTISDGFLKGNSANFTTPSAITFTGNNPSGSCITVVDDNATPANLLDDVTLGTSCVGVDTNPKSFPFSRTYSVPANDCLSYTNTAKFTGAGVTVGLKGSDSATVQVCGPAKTGALTMGFWQNKNGQAIITGGASTGSPAVCNSGTWLRQFAPFLDLSATASCSAVATYVTNVIKAANASGAAMNAMLKAQMLSTALDVYFSSTAAGYGGNKIGAPGPVGSVAIDLTQICKMIDGSGGTATCSGTFENTSPAFGTLVCPNTTVLALLTYAASQSNGGGSAWYGQVKATQGLAKDTFDAINNQVAFKC
jgi:hypothetical protein